MRLTELPYPSDSAELFAPLARRSWSMWLDSGRPAGTYGRYDVLVFDPVATLTTRGAVTQIDRGGRIERSDGDPLALLRNEIATHAPSAASNTGLPFSGGAVGYFAYDLGRRFESVSASDDSAGQAMPDMAVGIYDRAIVVDHDEKRCFMVGPVTLDPPAPVLQALDPLRALGEVSVSLDARAYRDAFERVQRYIAAGDCYQVNLARRFSVRVGGDPWAGYLALRKRSPAPYGAYLAFPFGQVLCNSPERFLHVRDGQVHTRPIKGTRPRHADPARDRQAARELVASAKDRAENVMIVDLLRNDLGKVCEVGSVRAQELCRVESFATVHHLVSTVSGRLARGRHALDALRACFPGGSITGAPKIRAMQIIDELEWERRGVYCGAIGYIGFDGAMDTNVAIRTLTHAEAQARFWAGGGIVVDSVCEQEYEETLIKAAAMFALLGIERP